MKILAGVHSPDEGTVELDGAPSTSRHPRRGAGAPGSRSSTRSSTCCPSAPSRRTSSSAASRSAAAWSTAAAMETDTARLLDGARRDLLRPAVTWSGTSAVAQQQVVEIVKALALDARIIVMDEPTAALAEHEVELLYALVRRLQERGIAVLYVSHRLARGVRPVRRGSPCSRTARWSPPRPPPTSPPTSWSGHGRPGPRRLLPAPRPTERPRRGTPRRPRRRQRAARRRSTSSCAPGRSSASAGCRAPAAPSWPGRSSAPTRSPRGTIELDGAPVRYAHRPWPPGIGAVSPRTARPRASRWPVGARQRPARRRAVFRYGAGAQDRHPGSCSSRVELSRHGPSQEIRYLSGGNQQKVVLANWLAVGAADPALRRADPGHRRGRQGRHPRPRCASSPGTASAILMISSELPELLGMSDRIVVMRDGRIAGELPAGATEETVVGPRDRRRRHGGADDLNAAAAVVARRGAQVRLDSHADHLSRPDRRLARSAGCSSPSTAATSSTRPRPSSASSTSRRPRHRRRRARPW